MLQHKSEFIWQKKEPRRALGPGGVDLLATTYFHTGYPRTIIGDDAFHFRVRDGNGWFHVSLATRRCKFKSRLEFKFTGVCRLRFGLPKN